MPTLPPEIFQQLIQFIQPFMTDPQEREAWLTIAFYLPDPRLLLNVDRSGNAMVFSVGLVKFLIQFGCLSEPDRPHAGHCC